MLRSFGRGFTHLRTQARTNAQGHSIMATAFWEAVATKSNWQIQKGWPGVPITKFVGLRSKMCSYVKDNDKGGKNS